jgi:hypothetical protein
MPWRCFMTAPSEFGQRSLRRYAASALPCKGKMSYHDAEAVIDERFPMPEGAEQSLLKGEHGEDPRWPKQCSCGYTFQPEDHWQVNETRLYQGAPGEKLYRLRDLPPGAVWRATWMEDIQNNPYAAPDGKVWALMMPSGMEWLVYGPASGGGKWVVQGELPRITVSPSIHQVGSYHGFVRDGVITDDCEGKKFPQWPSTT